MSLIDRGGLTHIGNVTFCVFGAMELQVKNFFSRHPTQLGQVKQELKSNIYKDDDLLGASIRRLGNIRDQRTT